MMYTFGTLAAKAIKQFERPTISVVRKCYQSNFLSGASTQYVEELYIAWLKDPSSVHVSWASYFRSTLHGKGTYGNSPALACLSRNVGPISQTLRSSSSVAGAGDSVEQKTIDEHIAVQGVIRNYQAHGHLVAELDPLGIMYADQTTTISDRLGGPPKEVLRRIDLDIDMDKIFTLPPTTFIGGKEKRLPLGEILRRLELSYCRHIGVEYMSIDNRKQRDFICQKMEAPNVMDMTEKQKRLILARLTRAAGFEAFLARKWPSEKRFGLEGCEILIPAMKQLIDKSTEFGVKTVIIGLAHRGRLNILANVCRKPLRQLFTQFAGLKATDQGSGDVKYHLGTYIERLNRVTNKNIRLALMANPSHLESTNTLVQGRTRAEQFYRGDSDGKHVMAIQLHGDASFCGQGVVYETMHLSDLPCYTTGGTIHIIVNNQIGFTTDPRYSRSSPYCTDVGHVLKAPIFHVNSDDPENVIHVCNIAAEWRATFHRDIIIDLVCYRRNGHNETDEPMFTQPLMYRKIRALKPILEKYSEQLIGDGIVTVKEVDDVKQKYYQICEDEFEAASKITSIKYKDWIDSPWPGFFEGKNPLKIGPTGVSEATLVHIGKKFSSHPPSSAEFVVHKGLERIFKGRMKMVKERIVDWSLGEAMAIGSLLKEGIHVRLSGQDVERGTFSHRHHVLHHQTMDKTTYEPLNNLYPDQAQYKVCNSSLSEYGVLGFEVGFSMASPNSLVLWEAQFGDFCNVGQCVIDQILSAGEAKWIRQCGLVMLLPHGYEGMGPEHSSARIERFLQMSADDPDVFPEESEGAVRQLIDTNWIVANCTTPANLFHIWRRQITMPFRKPLIIFSPKSLLRHPEARSSLDDMLENTQFQRVIFENGPAAEDPAQVKKLVFCTGKVYFEVKSARKKKGLEKTIAITRIEQLTPFPFDLVKQECEKYPNSTLCWAQEEPKNQGCWTYVKARLETSTGKQREIFYAGRRVAASPATGSKVQHLLEVKNLLDDAVKL